MAILPGTRKKYLAELRKRLLLHRGWNYLRYLHLRDAFTRTEGVRSALAIGAGRGYAELALAIEFPDVAFTITELEGSRGSRVIGKSHHLAETWKLDNVAFAFHDIREPVAKRHDFVSAIEVLEHIAEESLAAAQLRAASNRYVFVLVPFAEARLDADPKRRERVLAEYGHHRLGYDEPALAELFPRGVHVQGCYWNDRGAKLRETLGALDDDAIVARQSELEAQATEDLDDRMPEALSDAQGIRVLAEV